MSGAASAIDQLAHIEPRAVCGAVCALKGLAVEVRDLPLPVGTVVRIDGHGGRIARGEVVGFTARSSIVMLLDESVAVRPGARVIGERLGATMPVGEALLGRPIDGGPPLHGLESRRLHPDPIPATRRGRIHEPLPTGVRAIDGMLTLGRGQRIGVFAGPGVGKSTLMSQIARNTAADVNVIAMVGERGREVPEFLHKALGPEGLARSVVVVSTSDESPVMRMRAAFAATTVAEHFRDRGADVMLMMDSVTRLAQAQRQVGLTAGEPPATRGYPPSVFAVLPRLLERAGPIDGGGSITGVYTVLVEGDDLTEPVSDAVRGILDGHIALSRSLASRGHHPAIDMLESVSRVADDVIDDAHRLARDEIRRMLAARARNEELISVGAYVPGTDPDCDRALARRESIDAFLRQPPTEGAAYPETCRRLAGLVAGR
jgi:flagellum-specific ATP synthase